MSDRTRSRTLWANNCPYKYPNGKRGSRVCDISYESITDTVFDFDWSTASEEQRKDARIALASFRKKFKPVVNSRITAFVPWLVTYNGRSINSAPMSLSQGLGKLVDLAIPPEQLEQETVRALQRIRPSVEKYFGNFNLATFVLELVQVKQLATLVASGLKKATLDNANEMFIGHQFGVLPLVSDIRKIYSLITSIDAQIDKWNSFATSRRVLNAHGQAYDITSDFSGRVETGGSYGQYLDGTITVSRKKKVHMYFRARYLDEAARGDITKMAWGLDRLLTGVWNAIPFSWVVDYFTNIGDLIAEFERGFDSSFAIEYVDGGTSEHIYNVANATFGVKTPRPGSLDGYFWSESIYQRTVLSAESFDKAIRQTQFFEFDTDLTTMQTTYLISVGRLLTRKR